jgi:hypothetical protein
LIPSVSEGVPLVTGEHAVRVVGDWAGVHGSASACSVKLAIGADDLSRLEVIARSRKGTASRVTRARILLAYRSEPSSTAVGARIGVTHHTVQRCLRRAVWLGAMAALDDGPRPGKLRKSLTKRRPGWCLWPVRRPRTSATRRNCGQPGCWRATPTRMRWLPDCLPDAHRPGHGLQDTGRAGDQAA